MGTYKDQREKSPEIVIEEIDHLHRKWGTESVFFEDSTCNPNKKRLETLCEMYISKALHDLVNLKFCNVYGYGNLLSV